MSKSDYEVSLCVECGPNLGYEEDGGCPSCGVTCIGEWLEEHNPVGTLAARDAELARLRLEADLRVGSVVVDEQTWMETRDAALRVPVLEDELEAVRRDKEFHDRANWLHIHPTLVCSDCQRITAQLGKDGVIYGDDECMRCDEEARADAAELSRDTARQSAERALEVVRQCVEGMEEVSEWAEIGHWGGMPDSLLKAITTARRLLGEE